MPFTFKQFHCDDSLCGMKISTDGVLLGAWAECSGSGHVADIGAGSGLISLMMAQRYPNIGVTAVELDAKACENARANIAASPWAERIAIANCDFAEWQPEVALDAIVSNPPFFSSELRSPSASRALARHENSGLGYASLIARAAEMLSPEGTLSMILPAECESDVIYQGELARLKVQRLCRVHPRAGRKALRVMISLGLKNTAPQTSHIVIRESSGAYTEEYKALTRNFYLNF